MTTTSSRLSLRNFSITLLAVLPIAAQAALPGHTTAHIYRQVARPNFDDAHASIGLSDNSAHDLHREMELRLEKSKKRNGTNLNATASDARDKLLLFNTILKSGDAQAAANMDYGPRKNLSAVVSDFESALILRDAVFHRYSLVKWVMGEIVGALKPLEAVQAPGAADTTEIAHLKRRKANMERLLDEAREEYANISQEYAANSDYYFPLMKFQTETLEHGYKVISEQNGKFANDDQETRFETLESMIPYMGFSSNALRDVVAASDQRFRDGFLSTESDRPELKAALAQTSLEDIWARIGQEPAASAGEVAAGVDPRSSDSQSPLARSKALGAADDRGIQAKRTEVRARAEAALTRQLFLTTFFDPRYWFQVGITKEFGAMTFLAKLKLGPLVTIGRRIMEGRMLQDRKNRWWDNISMLELRGEHVSPEEATRAMLELETESTELEVTELTYFEFLARAEEAPDTWEKVENAVLHPEKITNDAARIEAMKAEFAPLKDKIQELADARAKPGFRRLKVTQNPGMSSVLINIGAPIGAIGASFGVYHLIQMATHTGWGQAIIHALGG